MVILAEIMIDNTGCPYCNNLLDVKRADNEMINPHTILVGENKVMGICNMFNRKRVWTIGTSFPQWKGKAEDKLSIKLIYDKVIENRALIL